MSASEPAADSWSVARLLNWTRDYFQRSGVESPRLCAELLLAHALQCERIQLYTRFEEAPAEPVRGRFRELVKQAVAGHPIAYLTGTKEFFSLPFDVGPDVLIPRPETEMLVERTIALVRREYGGNAALLDLGTGSGCIIVSLARHLPEARLFASDISPAALSVAQRNAARHGVTERIDFRAGGLFEAWDGTEAAGGEPRFDVIVCNPPYVATGGAPVDRSVRDFEPRVAVFAGADGLAVIRPLVREAPGWLRAAGHLLLEVAFDQARSVSALLAAGRWRDIVTYKDGAGHERVVHARR